jgi:hypothetical protein
MSGSLGRPILSVATLVVVASIIAGIVAIGSPSEGRFQQLDSGRVADLQSIMSATDEFWSRNERLPTTLDELADDPRASVNTVDPGSALPYGYRVVDEDRYELCATFDRPSSVSPGRPREDFWRHGEGERCFELEVDRTLGREGG